MDFLRSLIRGLGPLLVVQAIAVPVPGGPMSGLPAGPDDPAARAAEPNPSPSYIILNSPKDLEALLQKIRHPDLEVRRVDKPSGESAGDGPGGRSAAPPGVVESVRVRGRVAESEDFANLNVELAIVTMSDEPAWVVIRLDGQKPTSAREGARELDLRTIERGQWQVELAGRGRHRVEVELRVPILVTPARQALTLAIPEAASTSLELDFPRRKADILIGANENFGQVDLPGGPGTRLSARLFPRPRIDVSWTDDADATAGPGGRNPPLLTTQGEIAIDIDDEQMRTRSSWVIGCLRGMTRTLEVGVDDRDEVTEVRLDDQETDSGVATKRQAGRLTIRLGDPMRPGTQHRLVMRTRRPSSRADGRRVAFRGFALMHAREQSGFIGVTQGPNLWISPASAQAIRQVEVQKLPRELRERPATRLAFEFLDQPFLLDLEVEPSPPLVRARSRTLFRIEGEDARSETTLELEWVRGQLFAVGLGIGPGLQLVSVGPPEVVEGSGPAGAARASGPDRNPPDPDRDRGVREWKIGLTELVRDPKKVTLKLEGRQRIPRDGLVALGLFTPREATSVDASFALVAPRGFSLELNDDSGRITRPGDLAPAVAAPSPDRPASTSRGENGSPNLALVSNSNPDSLPIRIRRHSRALAQETVLSAQVSRRGVDLLQKTTFTVRFGTVGSLEIRVPAALSGRWELLDREIIDREDLGKDPDGTRRYRLDFDRPVLDKATLRFRCRLPVTPQLDANSPRDIAVPGIAFPGVPALPARMELAPGPEIVVQGSEPGWVRGSDDPGTEPGGQPAVLTFTEESGRRGGSPFVFRALALEPVALPPLVIPRLLVKAVQGFDATIRVRAWYWAETHGSFLAFALPPGAHWIATRVDGRATDQIDSNPARSGYRLRLPAEVGTRPVLVELEYQLNGAAAGPAWPAPRLLDGGLVLETLWEVQLPFDQTLVGVPRGYTDENEWYWDGNFWKRRPWKRGTALGEWLLGNTAPPGALEPFREASLDDTHAFLFSRAGPPADLAVWTVSRAWVVATCSGAALILGFLAIFSRIRFRALWLVAAGLALPAAALLHPSVTWLAVQSAFIGVALSLLGWLIQHLLERTKTPTIPLREPSSTAPQPAADSSLNRASGVGSDDSTAIRVRVPSTIDFVPAPLAATPAQDEPQSSTLGRAE